MQLLTGDLGGTATYASRSYAWVSLGTGEVTFDRQLPPTEVVLESGEVVTVPGAVARETIPALGKLTIKVQSRSRRYTEMAVPAWAAPYYRPGKPTVYEVDTYAVEEAQPEEPGTRLFVLLNLTDPVQREPYKVTLGGMNRCRCMAGQCRVASGCKHRDALAALIEQGAFDDAEPPPLDLPADSPERSGRWHEPDPAEDVESYLTDGRHDHAKAMRSVVVPF